MVMEVYSFARGLGMVRLLELEVVYIVMVWVFAAKLL